MKKNYNTLIMLNCQWHTLLLTKFMTECSSFHSCWYTSWREGSFYRLKDISQHEAAYVATGIASYFSLHPVVVQSLFTSCYHILFATIQAINDTSRGGGVTHCFKTTTTRPTSI